MWHCGDHFRRCHAIAPRHKVAIAAFLLTVPFHLILQYFFPEMNYFVRAMWVILAAFSLIALTTGELTSKLGIGKKLAPERLKRQAPLFVSESRALTLAGWGLLASLALLHWIFH